MYLYNQEYIIGSHVIVTTATILVWEVITTLDEEINFIWMQKWTLGTFLFWANRYLPFIDTVLALHVQFKDGIAPQTCNIYYRTMLWMVAFGLFVSALIISLRTYAIWAHKRLVLYMLLLVFVIASGISAAGIILENYSFRFEYPPSGGVGCKVRESGRLIVIPYIAVALSETTVVCLTVVRGLEHFRSVSQYSWVSQVYGYGLLFYIYLLIITVANITIPFVVEEPRYKGYFAVLQHVLHSIFCTRVILLIQQQRCTRRTLPYPYASSVAQNLPMAKVTVSMPCGALSEGYSNNHGEGEDGMREYYHCTTSTRKDSSGAGAGGPDSRRVSLSSNRLDWTQ